MIIILWFSGLEFGLLHAHMNICHITKFAQSHYITISNQVTEAKVTMQIGFLNLCLAVTTDANISS